jgi:uncharacterized protein (DUF362 family)
LKPGRGDLFIIKKMSKLVSLVKGDDRYKNVMRSLELIKDDLSLIKGKRSILIKPNLTATKNTYANTDVRTVEAVLDFLYAFDPGFKDKEIVIAEGSGSAYYEHTTTGKVFEDFGFNRLTDKYKNVKLKTIEDANDYFPLNIKTISGNEKIMVWGLINKYDYRISVAVPKTHNYAIATFGIKNMAGFIKQEHKSIVHGLRTPSAPNAKNVFTYMPTSWISWARRRIPGLVDLLFKNSLAYLKSTKVIHHNIVEFAKISWPDLVVLDGYNVMEGRGPVDGDPLEMKFVVSSADPLKADALAARLMGIDPLTIGYLFYMHKLNMGDISQDGLLGDRVEDVMKTVKLHPTYRIQKEWKEF